MIRAAVAILLLGALGAAVAAEPVLVPGETLAPAVERLGSLDGVEALGLSADGAAAVAAWPSPRDDLRSVLRVARSGGTARELELPGRAGALVVLPAGDGALVLVRELGKKREIRAALLLRVDLVAMRIAGQAQLPLASAGLALRGGGDAVLAATRDEVRTFALPDLRSGPLYRILGDNVCVAPIAASTRALVAQSARILLVDLSSAQGRDGLPVLDAIDLAKAPRALVAAPDQPAALLLDEGGSVLRVEVDPLRARPIGRAVAIAWPGERAAPASPATGGAAAVPAAAAVVGAAAADEGPPPAAAPSAAVVDTPPVEAAHPVVADSRPTPPPAAPAAPLPAGSIAGRVEGALAGSVAAVVVFGPDNVLKEAARAVPGPDGAWRVVGLAPGGYRIVAAGIGGRVLICDPPYAVAKVEPGAGSEAPALNVLREAPRAPGTR